MLSFVVDPQVHTTIWAATDDRLLVSRDASLTWVAPPIDLANYYVQRLASGADGAIYAIASNVSTDAFALKLDPTGSKLVYCTYLGGSGPEWGQSIAVDNTGRAYITGFTSSFDYPLANAMQSRPAGLFDAFVSVLDPTGSQLVWSTFLGGAGDDSDAGIVVDAAGNVHIVGSTSSPDFPLRQASQTRLAGSANAFAAKLAHFLHVLRRKRKRRGVVGGDRCRRQHLYRRLHNFEGLADALSDPIVAGGSPKPRICVRRSPPLRWRQSASSPCRSIRPALRPA